MTHFSPLSGDDDVPENYHTLTYELEGQDGHTRVSLSQDNNPSAEAAEHSRENWEKMLVRAEGRRRGALTHAGGVPRRS